jgi:hypothetical protein
VLLTARRTKRGSGEAELKANLAIRSLGIGTAALNLYQRSSEGKLAEFCGFFCSLPRYR